MKLIKKFTRSYDDYDEYIDVEDVILNGEFTKRDVDDELGQDVEFIECLWDYSFIQDYTEKVFLIKFNEKEYILNVYIPLNEYGEAYGFDFDYGDITYTILELEEGEEIDTRLGFKNILNKVSLKEYTEDK